MENSFSSEMRSSQKVLHSDFNSLGPHLSCEKTAAAFRFISFFMSHLFQNN